MSNRIAGSFSISAVFAVFAVVAVVACLASAPLCGDDSVPAGRAPRWLWSTAHAVPKQTTSEGSGYFSIVEGDNGKLYIGTAKYRHNAYLVEFDPQSRDFKIVVDAQREIGSDAAGFAAQAKIHTRNNVGRSGRIYFGTKQGYPQEGESRKEYRGGHPMVYDPQTGKTQVFPIPIPEQGVISVAPDESRGVAYLSTCSDERPVESAHFMILNLKSGEYRDLGDTHHMYAFIVVDHRGRAYHPLQGGEIGRYDPQTETFSKLKQTIDGQPAAPETLLAEPQTHPINWEISPDRRTLYAVAMSGNQLFAYDLDAESKSPAAPTLAGRRLGPLIAEAEKTDCRALCVGPDGDVWCGVAATFKGRGQELHLVRYVPGSEGPVDLGPIAIRNPAYTEFDGADGKPLPWHHGVHRIGQTLVPRYSIMGICAARNGSIYLTTLYPFTLHEIRLPQLAAVVTEYRHNSHADVIVSRLLQTDTLDMKGRRPALRLASLYTDQTPAIDTSREFSRRYGFPIAATPAAAVELPSRLDGVLLIAEHGDYPETETGQFAFPKRRLFTEVVTAMRKRRGDSQAPVPMFIDKHLADNWEDAKWIYDTARRENIPLMAGSSLPGLWRYPPVDVRRGAKLKEIVAVSYHRLDAYGFHALEMVQCLAERRAGGETGVKSVQCLSGAAVWEEGKRGGYDSELLAAALRRLKAPPRSDRTLEQLVREPDLFIIDYEDGLRANVLTLNGAVAEWSVAWRDDANKIESTLFWTQEERPFQHFSFLLEAVEAMMHTGQPAWPVERTLLTTGLLDALHVSKHQGGKRLETPQLKFSYQTEWNWAQPPPPPPGRPITEQ